MSGGGGSSSPSTQTQISDVPAWERGYLQDALGKATAISNQPYQQYPGQQIAGFTPDQMQSFSQIENLGNSYAPTQNAAIESANNAATSANGIYGAGAENINASTGYNPLAAVAPLLGQSLNYNAAAAGQPWLNQAAGYQSAAAQAGTPQGIQSYMSPYTGSVVQGIQDEANQNWNQNIMPGVNDKFVGSGQYGSGRNTQVLGQAAGNFQTGLSANVANALQSGYGMAGNQAAAQAQLLAGLGNSALSGASTAGNLQNQQVSNLLNAANAAGTATNQQASNLQNAGTALGNLASTQAGQQNNAAVTLGNLSKQQQDMGLSNAQALQAIGQQQQQLNQSNLDVAQQNWQNQVNYPKNQVEWMTDLVHGLPTPTSSTQQQTPAYSISPLSALAGAGATALSLSGNVATKKKGGLIKKYAEGGSVDDAEGDDDNGTPLDSLVDNPIKVGKIQLSPLESSNDNDSDKSVYEKDFSDAVQNTPATNPIENVNADDDSGASKPDTAGMSAELQNIVSDPSDKKNDEDYGHMDDAAQQRDQLLALARGLLIPQRNGSAMGALGTAVGNLQDTELQQRKYNNDLREKTLDRQFKQQALNQEAWDVKPDAFGNLIRVNKNTGEVQKIQGSGLSDTIGNQVAGGQNASGDDVLKGLQPQVASQVKALAEGRMQFPGGFALKSPYWQQMISLVSQYDPNFDTVNYNKRAQTAKSFAPGGKDRQNVNSIETALNTLSLLYDTNHKLGGPNDLSVLTKPVNYLRNKALSLESDTDLARYNKLAKDAADEVTKAIVANGGTGGDREKRLEAFSADQSPEARKAVIQASVDELMQRMNPVADAYNSGMGATKNGVQLLTPQAQKAYNKVMGFEPKLIKATGKSDQDVGTETNSIPKKTSNRPTLADLIAEKKRRQQQQ